MLFFLNLLIEKSWKKMYTAVFNIDNKCFLSSKSAYQNDF